MRKLYFVALFPPVELLEEIKSIKEEIRKRFNAAHALKIPAHITLQPPMKIEVEEEKSLIARLAFCAEKQYPFEVVLSGFDSFPPRVLFVRIKVHAELTRLHEQVKESLTGYYDEKQGLRSQGFHPHINIASKDLSREAYYKAWQEFRNKDYNAFFTAKSFFLLKHDGKRWEAIREFKFGK